jgi:protein phosphatase
MSGTQNPDTQKITVTSKSLGSVLISNKPKNSGEVAGLSDVGMVRELNEDNWYWGSLNESLTLYAVADGMGGHDSGEVASELAVETLFRSSRDRLSQMDSDNEVALRDLLRGSFEEANRTVVTTGMDQESNMGTTLCAILVNENNDVVAGNVGDSRIYLLRDGELSQISQDHSLVAFLVQLGELSDEEARDHPSGNILVRSIGSVIDVEVDLFHVKSKSGDRLLLCSDGLWGEIPDDELATILTDIENPEEACSALIEVANGNGGRDNSTLIIVDV